MNNETSSSDMGLILIEVDGSKSDPIPKSTPEEREQYARKKEEYLNRLRPRPKSVTDGSLLKQ